MIELKIIELKMIYDDDNESDNYNVIENICDSCNVD